MFSLKLDEQFVSSYRIKPEPFGFNGLGSLVYHRTYSRVKSDGTKESWVDTCERVINGMYTILKDYAVKNKREWSDSKAQRSAQDAFDRLFNLKWTPPGRGLWMMGTPFIHERKTPEALMNCAFVSTSNIAKDFGEPFSWAMEKLMLGVGVGFDTLGANKIKIADSDRNIAVKSKVVTIEDSREGWVDSVEELINFYIKPSSPSVSFDYSQIRKRGEPIKGFGGVASGPEPLIELHDGIRSIFESNAGKEITSRVITDVMNMIGRCVVAGNVRRSAEIALGQPDDTEFLNLKNYSQNPERQSFGWASNNTVFATRGMDYSDIVDRIFDNGEPGLIWIDNARIHGRMNGVVAPFDNVTGVNPCGEQFLESYELCTLVETYPDRAENLYDYLRTLKYAYLYGKAVTLMSEDIAHEKSREVMLKNRRIGTSNAGVTQFIAKNDAEEMREWFDRGYEEIARYDKVYSMWLGVPRSIRMTTSKPGGTVPLLAGATPGVHYPHSEYYIRRIRVSADSDLWRQYENNGYHVEKDVASPNTMIISFPIHAGSGITSASSTSIWQQLSLAAMVQKHWSDNGVSVTVTFDPSKTAKKEMVEALEFFESQLKAVSFLPVTSEGVYEQMPYEEITKEEYEETIRRVDEFSANVGARDRMEDKYCDGEACAIPGLSA